MRVEPYLFFEGRCDEAIECYRRALDADQGPVVDASGRGNVERASRVGAWSGWAISGLVAMVFVISAAMKLKGGAEVTQGMAHLGLPESLILPLTILEAACVAIYLTPATSVLGAILLTGYIGGAICAHVRVGDPVFVQIALGIIVWLGLYLREARLRQLIPLRVS